MNRASAEHARIDAVEWAVAGRPMPGEIVSGDLHIVIPTVKGALIGVIDGLGHGPEAAAAAHQVMPVLSQLSDASIGELIHRCHRALLKTRGVVLSLVSIDAGRSALTWLGVGNVEGALLRANPSAEPPRESLSMRGGVVGFQLPPLRETTLPIERGDVLVLATDGIANGFLTEVSSHRDPQDIADRILAHHAKATDDALALVVRYVGTVP
jgi:negative regulator of sigma-B (phosphoserine phosphatase)